MQREISSLAKKKHWTGRDVGLAYLAWASCDIKERREKQRKLPFTIRDIMERQKELTDEERADVTLYEKIALGLNNCRTFVMMFRQQFFAGYYRYFFALQEARRAEEYFATLEQLPAIMTREEYETKKEKFLGLVDNLKASVAFIVENMAVDFAWGIAEGREVPQKIRAAIEQEGKEPVTNRRVLNNYVDQIEYFLPDGTGTKDSSFAAWQEALARAYCETRGIKYDRKKADEARLNDYYRLLFMGRYALLKKLGHELTEKEADAALAVLERIIEEAEGTVPKIRRDKSEAALRARLYIEDDVQCGTNNDPPEKLTKWNILKDRSLFMYRGILKVRRSEPYGEYIDEISPEEQYEEFKKDFPKTYKAVYDYLLQIVPEAAKVRNPLKPFMTWAEVVNRGYERSWTNTGDALLVAGFPAPPKTTEEKNLQERALKHGVAILQNPALEYVDPVTDGEKRLAGITHLMNSKKESTDIRIAFDGAMLPALSFVVTYNEFVKAFAKVYKLKFLEDFCLEVDFINDCVENANKELFLLCRRAYGTEAEKKKKRNFLRKAFTVAYLEGVMPDPGDIKQFKKQLQEHAEEGGEYALSLVDFLKDTRKVVIGLDGERY